MTTTRPVVHARFDQEYSRHPMRNMAGELTRVIVTPGVHVAVEFDLHTHEEVLRQLDLAVADVRAQIEETK